MSAPRETSETPMKADNTGLSPIILTTVLITALTPERTLLTVINRYPLI